MKWNLVILAIGLLACTSESSEKKQLKTWNERIEEHQSEIVVDSLDKKVENEDHFSCEEFDFPSTQIQADSLTSFMKKALKSDSINRIFWEKKFFCAFPSTFSEMEDLFGFDDETGAAPLYSTSGMKYEYLDRHIPHDIIGMFNELTSIPDDSYYGKYISICSNGKWQADNIQEGFGLRYRILDYPDAASLHIAKLNDEEIAGAFRFIFDGPHPDNDYNRNALQELESVFKSRSIRLNKILNQSFVEVMNSYDEHGH